MKLVIPEIISGSSRNLIHTLSPMVISKKDTIRLFHSMLQIRYTEETIASRYSEWKMRCPTHLSTGQEAVASGICLSLRNDDFVMSTHRAHAHYIAKGGNLNKMIAEIYGKVTGCTSGKGGSMHLIDKDVGFMGSTSIVGNTIPLAVGLGLSITLNKTNQLSCVFFGDGAVEEGVFYESINFAVLKKLPVLFICENNLYSVYSPLKVRQPKNRKISEMVKGIGIPSDLGDGNDVMEVFSKTQKAIDKIRKGDGPYFLEFSTYRWREHCGPNYDNDIGYRTINEFKKRKLEDPIQRIEKYIFENNYYSREEIMKAHEDAKYNVNEAFEFAEQSAFPDPNSAYNNLFR